MELLVVDDEASILNVCLRGISKDEFSVAAAESVEEAMRQLARRRFDIVLTDLIMAPMNGLHLIKHVLAHHAWTDVIVMTGYPSFDNTVKALQLGATDYITKPLDLILLKAALRRCSRRRELEKRLEESAAACSRIAKGMEKAAHHLNAIRRTAVGGDFELERDACLTAIDVALRDIEALGAGMEPHASEGAKPL